MQGRFILQLLDIRLDLPGCPQGPISDRWLDHAFPGNPEKVEDLDHRGVEARLSRHILQFLTIHERLTCPDQKPVALGLAEDIDGCSFSFRLADGIDDIDLTYTTITFSNSALSSS